LKRLQLHSIAVSDMFPHGAFSLFYIHYSGMRAVVITDLIQGIISSLVIGVGLVIIIVALVIAMLDLPNLAHIAIILYEGLLQIVPVLLFAMFWKRSNKHAALWGMLVGLAVAIVFAAIPTGWEMFGGWTPGIIGCLANVVIHVILGFAIKKEAHVDELFAQIKDYDEASELEPAELIAEFMQDFGCTVELQEVDPGRPNVIATLAGNEPDNILFNGHTDTVKIGNTEKWKHDPLAGVVEDGYLYGRGSADMKAGLAAQVFAMKMLADSGVPRKRSVMFTGVIDEEVFFKGTKALIAAEPE